MTERKSVYTDIKETKHGLREINDIINLFGYSVKLPSEATGSVARIHIDELRSQFPYFKRYMANMRVLSQFLKTHALGHDVDSFRLRAPLIESSKRLIRVTSTLQFFKAFENMAELYLEEEKEAGWGMLSIRPCYQDKVLVSTEVYIGDTLLDLSKPVPVQALTWDGRLIGTYDLINIVKQTGEKKYGEGVHPVFPALAVNEASMGDANVHAEAERRHGILNKGNVKNSMVEGVLDFPLYRILNEDLSNTVVDTYETPVFTELDFSHDIDMGDHIRMLTIYDKLQEAEQYDNTREFALLNLFRWGILNKEKYARASAIVNAVLAAPKIEDYQTIIDRKLFAWGGAIIAEVQRDNPKMDEKLIDTIIMSGSTISKIASMMSQAFLICQALIVTDVEKDDLGFREARIALRSKKQNTTRFTSMSRINTDDYKIVELDKDNNIIGVIDIIDVFAIKNHDVGCVVVNFDSNETNNKAQLDFYNAIQSYTPDLKVLA